MEAVHVTIDTTVLLGLVFNELITNIMKHAFPDERKDKFSIKLYKQDHKIHLELADNGVGFPENEIPDSLHSIGLGTFYTLVENQLHGTIKHDEENGVSWFITIEDKLYSKKV